MANEVGMPIPFELPRFELPALAEHLEAVDREMKSRLEVSLGTHRGTVDNTDPERLAEAYLLALGYLALGMRTASVTVPMTTGDDTLPAHEWVAAYCAWLGSRNWARSEAAKKCAELDPVRQ